MAEKKMPPVLVSLSYMDNALPIFGREYFVKGYFHIPTFPGLEFTNALLLISYGGYGIKSYLPNIAGNP